MNVTVVGGAGRLGSAMASVIAECYDVTIADKRQGYPSVRRATNNADIVIVMVNTGSKRDGSFDISNVLEVCAEIDLSQWRAIVVSCTVNPGDMLGPIKEALEQDGKVLGEDFRLAYSPEFMRQGSAREDFKNPAQVIIGTDDGQPMAFLDGFYRKVCGVAPAFMTIQSAEIAKLALNTFLTIKMSKANEIAWLCQKTPAADAKDVLAAVARDSRIEGKYMSPGPPYGGPCFPRDDWAFAHAMVFAGLCPTLSQSAAHWRRAQMRHMAELVGGKGQVGVVGLGFKAGVADDTESAAAWLARIHRAETYDPDLPSTCNSLPELVKKCKVIVLATPFDGMEHITELDLTGKTVWDWWGTFGDDFNRFGKGAQ